MTNNLIVPGTQSGLQTMIDLFNAIVGGPPAFGGFAAGTLALRRIYIPGYITPVYTEGAQVGVNKGMVNSVRGMQVFVQPYPNMLAGDLIEVFYGTSNIAAVKVSVREEQLGQNIETYIPAKKVLEGVHDLYYVITRAGSTNKESSLVLKVLARLKYPGGNDPEPDRPGHYKLLPPFLTSPPIGGVVGEEDFKDFLDGELYGVEVTVPAYPNMREYDTIRLSWAARSSSTSCNLTRWATTSSSRWMPSSSTRPATAKSWCLCTGSGTKCSIPQATGHCAVTSRYR